MENIEITEKIFKLTFNRASEEYKDFSETWKSLDGKAQATATISGIFVAATFAFVRNTALSITGFEKTFLISALVLLLTSIYWAVRSMVIREILAPPDAKELFEESKKILALSSQKHELEDRYIRQISDSIGGWVKVNERLKKVVSEKGDAVVRAQWSLLFSIVFFAVLICVAVI